MRLNITPHIEMMYYINTIPWHIVAKWPRQNRLMASRMNMMGGEPYQNNRWDPLPARKQEKQHDR